MRGNARQLVHISRSGDLAVVRGWQAQKLAHAAGIKAVYLGTVQGWTFSASRLPTYLAYLDHRHVGYSMQDELERDPLRGPDEKFPAPVAPAAPEPQLDLFGGGA